ncbi:Uncharacterized protein TCAP_01175 [Tolypocladium capitatum]|uniref:DUF1996 domain-containing protein n=1 Tax=Tolypocladium capitatum TaxID=45235 RepID=A0A2K3QN05_9HYPO|nr:Uncharacterized protein TCAP_01175 [Tolypocladium capitatum]
MITTMHKSVVALAAGLIAGANAFWRMECPGRVGLARLDPIVSPGQVSSHVHAIHGSSAFSENADTPNLLAGDCTSCRVTQDKSAYWHPALYFQNTDTGKFEVVQQVGGMLAYYLLYGNNITAFPSGFRMVSGNNDRRTYTAGDPNQPDPPKSFWGSMKQDDLAQRAIGFNCLNYGKTPEGTLYRHYLPDKAYLDANCKDGLRLELMFPSCWKGGDAKDSPNHQDHVAFPDLVMTGTCPKGYPVRLPSLLYEVIWNTAAFRGKNGRFVLANGDTTGYGYHGDFMMGWDEAFLQKAVNTCTNLSGKIEDCPLFNVVDQGKATKCNLRLPLPKPIIGENVQGPVANLPGNVQVLGGGSGDNRNGPAAPKPALTYVPGQKPSDSASPLPGQIFKDKSSSAAGFGIEAVTVQPTTPPATTPAPEIKSYYSTQYVTNGNVVSKILWVEQFVYVTQYTDTTTTVGIPAPPTRP